MSKESRPKLTWDKIESFFMEALRKKVTNSKEGCEVCCFGFCPTARRGPPKGDNGDQKK
uniref:Uncharacterized protein n=1 Tax=Anguilla anguilla TaxID=7936 RepID=A0A0E9XBG0_ANGAN